MSFGYFMNMEKLSLMITEKHIVNMTNDNYEDDIFLDIDKLINNMENGFVVIIQLSCFYESFLNTIINSCMSYSGDVLLKCSIEEKMEFIFMHYQKDWSNIKSQHCWEVYKKATKVRNEMIHFKKTYVGDGSGIPNFKLGGEFVADFFTKDNMKNVLQGFLQLTEEIANTLGLKIFNKIGIFECDGRDGLVNYVYDEYEIDIDEERF